MPYVMKHSATGTLLAAIQRNGYQLAYYGVLLWEYTPTEAQMCEALAEAGFPLGDEAGHVRAWESLLLSEQEMKMANVKLRNDPSRVVAYREGALIAN